MAADRSHDRKLPWKQPTNQVALVILDSSHRNHFSAASFGAAWQLAYSVALPALRVLAHSRIGRYFYLRETSRIADVMRVEWEAMRCDELHRSV